MPKLVLVIGTQRYSSWSLRPWLALKQSGLEFDEVLITLRQPDTSAQIAKASPSAKIPVLNHGDLAVWDSLAICEYVAELACAHPLWPENRGARAVARAAAAEMHSGFTGLRQHLSFDAAQRFENFVPPPEAQADITRIQALWQDCRARFGQSGPFLFGHFSIADAMFAPVVFRFQTYGVALDSVSSAYVEHMLALPAMQEWAAASR